MRNDADARDILQEAFMRFLRLEEPERLRNPEAYLFRIASNLLWERQLRERGEREQMPLDETPTEEHTPFDFAVAEQEAAGLRATLEIIPPPWRSVLMLHLRDGLSFSEIAANTGITTSLAKKHYYRALIACREYLDGSNIKPGSGS